MAPPPRSRSLGIAACDTNSLVFKLMASSPSHWSGVSPSTSPYVPATPAPGRATRRATACPTWHPRPTPVTKATLPRKSGGMCHDVVHRRSAALCERDRAVALHQVDGPLHAFAVLLEGVVGARDRSLGV